VAEEVNVPTYIVLSRWNKFGVYDKTVVITMTLASLFTCEMYGLQKIRTSSERFKLAPSDIQYRRNRAVYPGDNFMPDETRVDSFNYFE